MLEIDFWDSEIEFGKPEMNCWSNSFNQYDSTFSIQRITCGMNELIEDGLFEK